MLLGQNGDGVIGGHEQIVLPDPAGLKLRDHRLVGVVVVHHHLDPVGLLELRHQLRGDVVGINEHVQRAAQPGPVHDQVVGR